MRINVGRLYSFCYARSLNITSYEEYCTVLDEDGEEVTGEEWEGLYACDLQVVLLDYEMVDGNKGIEPDSAAKALGRTFELARAVDSSGCLIYEFFQRSWTTPDWERYTLTLAYRQHELQIIVE